MKLSLNWISDYTDISSIATDDLVHRLTMSVCEVEDVLFPAGHLNGVITGYVKDVKKHPDADKLSVCTVYDGKEDLQIICGAPNVRKDIFTALAPVGFTLQTDEGSLKIEKRKIRGVESAGMLCSSKELGLERMFSDNGGILILDDLPELTQKPKPGSSLVKLLQLEDTVLDIDNKSITHRPDLWCHFGFAREISAIFKKKIKYDPNTVKPVKPEIKTKKKIEFSKDTAHAYFGLVCEGVSVKPSPLKIKARLFATGQKSINNIVDASNYCMLELGQPNHTFNLENLSSDTVSVIENEGRISEFTTLDGETRNPGNSILIFDGPASDKNSVPVAIGGIIGGESSSIQDDTRSLFIESACFPREKIRRSISQLGLRTDSAVRFEKGQDPSKAPVAVYRILEILKETCPELKPGPLSGRSAKPKQNRIQVKLSYLQMRLGFPVSLSEAVDIFERLSFTVNTDSTAASVSSKKATAASKKSKKTRKSAKAKTTKDSVSKYAEDYTLTVTVPSYRSYYDLTQPDDLVEEIGRIYGFDNIQPLPSRVPVRAVQPNRKRSLERRIKELFTANGFYETMNYSFSTAADNRLITDYDGLALENPAHAEQNVMRTTQIPGILKQSALNQNRFAFVKLFELGRTFLQPGQQKADQSVLPRENLRLTASFLHDQESGDELKAALQLRSLAESLFHRLAIYPVIQTGKHPAIHPGGCAEYYIDDKLLCVTGIIHPDTAESAGLKRPGALLDLDFDFLYELSEKNRKAVTYEPPVSVPDSYFEFAVVLKENESTRKPVTVAESLEIPEIISVRLLDIYHGVPLASDEKSASYRVQVRKKEETMSGGEVQSILEKIIAALKKESIPLRS